MRGLTPEGRYLLIEALHPSDSDNGCCTDQENATFCQMEVLGRVQTTEVVSGEYEWEDWRTTDLGRLALRVLPG